MNQQPINQIRRHDAKSGITVLDSDHSHGRSTAWRISQGQTVGVPVSRSKSHSHRRSLL